MKISILSLSLLVPTAFGHCIGRRQITGPVISEARANSTSAVCDGSVISEVDGYAKVSYDEGYTIATTDGRAEVVEYAKGTKNGKRSTQVQGTEEQREVKKGGKGGKGGKCGRTRGKGGQIDRKLIRKPHQGKGERKGKLAANKKVPAGKKQNTNGAQ